MGRVETAFFPYALEWIKQKLDVTRRPYKIWVIPCRITSLVDVIGKISFKLYVGMCSKRHSTLGERINKFYFLGAEENVKVGS